MKTTRENERNLVDFAYIDNGDPYFVPAGQEDVDGTGLFLKVSHEETLILNDENPRFDFGEIAPVRGRYKVLPVEITEIKYKVLDGLFDNDNPGEKMHKPDTRAI